MPQYIVQHSVSVVKMPRKTRFVCVSDTHGYTPSEAGFKLPPGDVLIHAGDLTNQGSKSELQKTIDWISKADYEVKIIVGGQFVAYTHPQPGRLYTKARQEIMM